MTLDEAMEYAESFCRLEFVEIVASTEDKALTVLATEVRRLQSEVERLPARRAQPTVKSKQIGPCDHAYWRLSHETDAEFAEWGNEYTEVAQ